MKKGLKIFYTSVPKIMIVCYTVPEIWRMMNVIVILHLGLFLALYPLTAKRFKILKKLKKILEISSLYISVTKIMIICCTVPEIWHVTHVIVISHFGYFLPFYRLAVREIKIFKKMKKTPRNIISHKCTKNHDHMLYCS